MGFRCVAYIEMELAPRLPMVIERTGTMTVGLRIARGWGRQTTCRGEVGHPSHAVFQMFAMERDAPVESQRFNLARGLATADRQPAKQGASGALRTLLGLTANRTGSLEPRWPPHAVTEAAAGEGGGGENSPAAAATLRVELSSRCHEGDTTACEHQLHKCACVTALSNEGH
jgi:hypothetical protein